MKAFVIKNKEGKYHKRGFSCWENIESDGVFNTGHFYYENKEEAESCIVSYGLEDCELVEITIAEGDLKQQLAKKDKEIKRLKECVMSRKQVEAILKPEIADLTKRLTKEITPIIMKECSHQVCDEIRKEFGYKHNNQLMISSKRVLEFLDKIEKGDK